MDLCPALELALAVVDGSATPEARLVAVPRLGQGSEGRRRIGTGRRRHARSTGGEQRDQQHGLADDPQLYQSALA